MEVLFASKMRDFAEDLARLNAGLPEPVPQLGLLLPAVTVMAAMGGSALWDAFEQHVGGPYGSRILNRDERFFLHESASGLSPALNRKEDMDVVSALRGVWKSLSQADRDAIWAHLELLVRLQSYERNGSSS